MSIEIPTKTPDGEPWPCKYCKQPTVFHTTDETFDGAYDRYHYHCHSCGSRWTIVDECD